MSNQESVRSLVLTEFKRAGVVPVSVEVRTYPDEVIALVTVDSLYDKALEIASVLDAKIERGFVTVRLMPQASTPSTPTKVSSVHDNPITELIELLNSRARASESQPSLQYVSDVEARVHLAISPRHHLVFGRRGVGKTSLLLEAKSLLERQGHLALWVNVHAFRHVDANSAFLLVASRLCDMGIMTFQKGSSTPSSVRLLEACREAIDIATSEMPANAGRVSRIVPQLQQALSRFDMETQKALYIFLDDVHYMPPAEVPRFLDLLHGITRDNNVWLKVAGIQHQTRWFISNPPTGLQTGHDASIINLDVTLEKPERAKEFLQSILGNYVDRCGARPISGFLSATAIDRLVLASGGVPRDFLTLCASSIELARSRPNARTVGVQDVNNAAGLAAQTKLQELEDDAAASQGRSQELIVALSSIREFLLTEQQITYFRVDFRDKEAHPEQYGLIQSLAELRMLHLVNPSLSDPHEAGRRSEVFLLDLSQYSGTRLKQRLRVLDFERGHMVLKRTRSGEKPRVGNSPKQLLALLRRAPVLSLVEGIRRPHVVE